jgi:hypothetical protein
MKISGICCQRTFRPPIHKFICFSSHPWRTRASQKLEITCSVVHWLIARFFTQLHQSPHCRGHLCSPAVLTSPLNSLLNFDLLTCLYQARFDWKACALATDLLLRQRRRLNGASGLADIVALRQMHLKGHCNCNRQFNWI